jgi:hypothetical protein
LELSLAEGPADSLSDPGLEALRRAIPAARGLPLLRLLAAHATGECLLDYLDVARAAVRVEAC